MAGDAGWTDLAALGVLAVGVALVGVRRSRLTEPQTTRLGMLLLPGLVLTGEASGWLGLVGNGLLLLAGLYGVSLFQQAKRRPSRHSG